MTDNPVELAEEAVACRLIADAFYARSKDLGARAAESMGRGTLYPKLPSGEELACFNVPADAETVTVDTDLLLPFVRQHYPTELMEAVRPAFVEAIRVASREAKQPCAPGGEIDPPGVTYSLETRGPRITARPAGKVRALAALDVVLAQAFDSFARPQIEGAA